MRKYWHYYKLGMISTMAYRGPLVVWLLGNTLSLVAIIAVWQSATASSLIGGYTKSELITYYIVGLTLQWLIGWFPFYQVKEEIANGGIAASTLVKPISYYLRQFFHEFGWHTVSPFLGFLISLSLFFIYRDSVALVHLDLGRILLLAFSVVISILTVFSLSLCLGLVAFWFTSIDQLDGVFWIGRTLFGGQGIPISFLPFFIRQLAFLLPFRYTYSFPLEIYFDKLSTNQIAGGLLIGLTWVVLLIFLYKTMWFFGTRAYTAFGN